MLVRALTIPIAVLAILASLAFWHPKDGNAATRALRYGEGMPLVQPAKSSVISAPRDLVARRWAPTLFQETLDPLRDYIAAFDFDGDWDGDNNAAHVGKFPLRAVVYYTVVETATHWFIQYMPYHPVDYKRINGHTHDTESILLVVKKSGGPFGVPEVMETRFHDVWYQYARPGAPVGNGADDIDGPIHFDGAGHPEVYAQRVGHGLCGGFSPRTLYPDAQITCDQQERPHLGTRGVIYRYTGSAEVPRPGRAIQQVGYDLVEMSSTLWAHARAPGAFMRVAGYEGERCHQAGFHCPRAIGLTLAAHGGGADAPWGQTPGKGVLATGDEFFDPAYTMARRLRFHEPFALAYDFNPYLGITPLAPRTAPTVALAAPPRLSPVSFRH